MKKITVLFCLLILVIGFNPIANAAAKPDHKTTADTVVIPPGETITNVVALCDNWPTFQDQFDAIDMAIDDYGPIKGFPVNYAMYTKLCDQSSGATWAEQIVNTWAPPGIIGPMYSSAATGALPIFEAAGIVMISQSTSNPALPNFGPHIFNRVTIPDIPTDGEYAGRWAQHINMLAPAQAWRAEFFTLYGRQPDVFAVLAYDAMRLLLANIDQVSYLDGGNLVIERDTLAAAVRNTSGFPGASWFISLAVNGDRIDNRYTAVWPDAFDDVTLKTQWSWLDDDVTHWSLTDNPGFLRIITKPEPMRIVRDIPKGDFEFRTRVLFTPTENFQFAGLYVYGSDENHLTFGRAFCNLPEPACVGNGIYFDQIEGGAFIDPNYATAVDSLNEAYLRLVKIGNVFTGYVSTDGVTWLEIGSHTIGFTATKIGLYASNQGQSVGEIPADFAFFTLQYATTNLFMPIISRNTQP